MPASDFYECFLADQINLFGERRDDIRAGIITAAVRNVEFLFRNLEPGEQPYQPQDFIIPEPDTVKPHRKEQTPEETLAMMLTMQAAQGKVQS